MVIKRFDELSVNEIYNIYKLRVEVFVVEQRCPYQEVDELDLFSYHLLNYEDDILAGYCRIIPPTHNEPTRIGRVATSKNHRGKGIGVRVMKEAINYSDAKSYGKIKISAQSYLIDFYRSFGFVEEGMEYVEDGIPHVDMVRG